MKSKKTYKIINSFIAGVWLINVFFCKVLHLVPRHEEIVSRILDLDKSLSSIITIFIGISEILMAIWVLSRIHSKLNAIVQILIVAIMNILEYLLVPDLLLWGRLNSLFAFLFIVLIFYNEFVLNKSVSDV